MELSEALKENGPVILDFMAPWCGPCKVVAPILDELSKKHGISVIKIDVDKHASLAEKFGVRGVPTIIKLVMGKEVAQVVGTRSKTDLENILFKESK